MTEIGLYSLISMQLISYLGLGALGCMRAPPLIFFEYAMHDILFHHIYN
jgi:hypothetical protein